MKTELIIKEKQALESHPSKEREDAVADPIKAVLLNAEGWAQKQIVQALRISYETVQYHHNDYKNSKKPNLENGRSDNHLTSHKTLQLLSHHVEFEDAVHPTRATKITYEWIRKV